MNSCVNVLMSTYNGEKYLVEQLESILAQTHRAMTLTIRDDGSLDSTPAILTRYALLDTRIKLALQENTGVVGSFHWLLAHAEPGCHYYAFADQDDVWLPNKLERALKVLAEHGDDQPLLYCARMEYVSAALSHLGFSSKLSKPAGLGNALVQNIATGCTIVLNKAARELLLKYEWPPHVLVHDWWFYLVVSAFGTVVHDDFVAIKYRQHGGNQIGGTVTFWADYKKRISNFINSNKLGFYKTCYNQANCFWKTYNKEISTEVTEILQPFIESKKSMWSRIKYLTCKRQVYRQTHLDDALLVLLILMNKY